MMLAKNPNSGLHISTACGKEHHGAPDMSSGAATCGYGRHESHTGPHSLIVKGNFVNKLSTDLMCRGINANNLTPLVCACLFRNHIFKHLMLSRYNDPNTYDLDCDRFKWVCHLTKTLDCSKNTLRFLAKLNDLTFPFECKLADSDWNLIKKRVKFSSFDIRAIWLGCYDVEVDTLNIGILIEVYQSVKCRKMLTNKCSEKDIQKYFETMSEDDKIRKIFMIALDCWANACDDLDNIVPMGTKLSCLSYPNMAMALDAIFKNKKPSFSFNMTRPLAFNVNKYNPSEREHLNKWLSNPANTSPSMPLIIALIQCINTGTWIDFYGKLNKKTSY